MDYRASMGRLMAFAPARFIGKQSAEGWARLAGFLGVIAVGMALAQLTWRFTLPEETATSRSPQSGQVAANPSTLSISELAEGHLFGLASAQPGGEINAPETTLSLILRGIFALDSSHALAIIANGGGEELPYRTGDTVPGGAIVHDIAVDKVILEREGRYETLTLPKESLANNGSTSSQGNGAASSANSASQRLGDIRNKLRANPSELMGMNALQPVMENGKLKGYQLEDNPYSQTMHAAGLMTGDVVTRVNGIAVTDQARAAELINQLSNSGRLNLEVERGGAPTNLSIDLGK